MRHIAFLRNVNQGQRGNPSTADIVGAFADAGSAGARTFQSNGTVVFESSEPDAVVADAVAALAVRSGVEREAFWMPITEVAAIVGTHSGAPDAERRELTLHAGGTIDLDDAAVLAVAAGRRCEIVDAGAGWIVSVNERDRESNATPVAERLTGGPATSRGMPTLVRLLDRFDR
ncbi:Uncharacterized conserved protein, DUF1697 family [Microbacterium sp. cf046]|uniref:DUF1697 domain-containing protein n=1 Tax=Microbacterium sp. cf046 TaxID=1761803 RepID=UPI0008F23CE6|nr:DUF1697 domain-containing protein [Microbacterium sp. cf046]SFS03853.1 Uncharacterized conserved protein, DUF1697 family [Microbacterium sp. cf046]